MRGEVAAGAGGAGLFEGRFEFERELGRGASGVVYLARDVLTGERVAVKCVARESDEAVQRARSEFRSVADATHDNLVALYELRCEGTLSAIVMEYVDGAPLLGALVGQDVSGIAPTRTTLEEPSGPVEREGQGARWSGDQLAQRFVPLLDGLAALHAEGLVHLDLKPNNVLVERGTGRVVVLDLGLARKVGEPLSRPAGTPAYVAPEVLAGAAPGPAADAYAVGVMLYEALTGQRPHTGTVAQVLASKRAWPPVAPRALDARVPEELEALCLGLLHPEPSRRPALSALRARLAPEAREPAPRRRAEGSLLGREALREELLRDFEGSASGCALRWLQGASGLGKSAVLRDLEERLRERGAAVLSGRCHAFETVRSNAVEALRRALDSALRSEPSRAPEAGAPDSTTARGATREALVEDLAQGLESLLRRGPVAVLLDDLQWCDEDSAVLLTELLALCSAPGLYVLLAARDEAVEASPLERLQGALAALPSLAARASALAPLAEQDAAALAQRCAQERGLLLSREECEGLGRASLGSPLYVEALVRGRAEGAPPGELDALLLHLLRARSAEEQCLLELLAVANGPLEEPTLARAAAASGRASRAALRSLVLAGLVRRAAAQRGAHAEYDVAHDRLREALLSSFGAPRRAQLDGTLASVLALDLDANAAALARHALRAGRAEEAARSFARAARVARAHVAYARAAGLLREALAHGAPQDPERPAWLRELGEALTLGGRALDAAEAFLAAAEAHPNPERTRLRLRAAEQWLIAGRLGAGQALLRSVAQEVSFELPSGPLRGLLAMARELLAPAPVVLGAREDARLRLEVARTALYGLGLTTPLDVAPVHLRGLRLAEALGEPGPLASHLVGQVLFDGAVGALRDGAAEATLARLEALVARDQGITSRLLGSGTRGVHHVQRGRFVEGVQKLAEAEREHRAHFEYAPWEVTVCEQFRAWGLYYLGRFGEQSRRVRRHARAAQERGDVYAACNFVSQHAVVAWLTTDTPREGRARLDEALARWPLEVAHVQGYYGLCAQVHLDLYEGRPAAAWARVGPRFAAASLARVSWVEGMRVDAAVLRARVAVAALLAGCGGRAPWVALLDAVLWLSLERAAWAAPFARFFRARFEELRGRSEGALRGYEEALSGFERHSLAGYAACARMHWGALRGGPEGRAAWEAGRARLAAEGVLDVDAFAGMMSPGVARMLPR